MLTRKQWVLILVAVLSVIGAGYVLYWSKQVDAQITSPEIIQVSEGDNFSSGGQETLPENQSKFLVSDFDELLSGEALGELYEGEEDYGFITTQE